MHLHEYDVCRQSPCMQTTTISHELKKKESVPRWVPVALLAVSTVALIVPIVLLKRQRKNALSTVPPPLRRTSVTPGPVRVPSRPAQKPIVLKAADPAPDVTTEDPNFNGALHSAKAFLTATAIVTVLASTGVWGAQTYLGVKNTEEFATRMRSIMLERMPVLSSRIHRLTAEEDTDDTMHEHTKWEWDSAQKRLSEAYDKDGFYGWAETALKEVEAEGKLERLKLKQLKESKDDKQNRV